MSSPRSRARLGVASAFAFQALLLALGVVQNHEYMNPDGVAYVRLAGYWARGDTTLAITSYWAPLFSWLMVPGLCAGVPASVTARIAVALSALAFLAGCVVLLRRLSLPPGARVLGAWLCALAGLSWSTLVNPDLLAAGLLAAGLGSMLSRTWVEGRTPQVVVGLLFGLAYLAKTIALPLLLVLAPALALGRLACGQCSRAGAVRAAGTTLAVATLIAAPWIATISVREGAPTLGSTARINHALVGPRDGERWHPYARRYHVPEPGRLTQWEDPSRMHYATWSPLDGPELLRHQVRTLAANLAIVQRALLTLDRLGLGVFAALAGLVLHRPFRENMAQDPWRWVALPGVLLCAAYLPFYANSLRYYFPVYPLLVGAGLGLATSFWADAAQRSARRVACALLAVSLFQPFPIRLSLSPITNPAYEAAARLRRAGLVGPLAGVAEPGSREAAVGAGLELAFFAGAPYYGSEIRPSPERILGSGAELVWVPWRSPSRELLDGDPRFESLDAIAFPAPGGARAAGFGLYRVRRGGSGPAPTPRGNPRRKNPTIQRRSPPP